MVPICLPVLTLITVTCAVAPISVPYCESVITTARVPSGLIVAVRGWRTEPGSVTAPMMEAVVGPTVGRIGRLTVTGTEVRLSVTVMVTFVVVGPPLAARVAGSLIGNR